MMDAWVSVKERLPEDEVWVRCKTKDRTFLGFYCGKLHGSCWFAPDHQHPGNVRVVYGVTHWRPK